jgi:predicted transcriptional regulator
MDFGGHGSQVHMLAIRLAQSIGKRLERLARRTGHTKTDYAWEAIREHLGASKTATWPNGRSNAFAEAKNAPFR